MKKLITLALASLTLGAALALTAAPSPPTSDPVLDLAKSKQCLTCHSVSGQLTAPSFQDIAKKWHGVKNADIFLAMVVQHGGTQHYGCNMMPPESARTKVSDADAMALSEWILKMKQ
jgi:cytochrome c